MCHSFSFEDKDVSVLGGGGARGKLIFVLPFCFHTWLSETCGVHVLVFSKPLHGSGVGFGVGSRPVPSSPFPTPSPIRATEGQMRKLRVLSASWS